jgi:hypothetical protein
MIDRRNFLGMATAAGGWTVLAESSSGRTEAPAVIVADAGRPRLTIVPGSVKDGVDELQQVLRRMSGAEFKIAAEPARTGSLFVGLAADFPALKIDRPDELGAEGFLLKTDGTHVWLIGNKPLGVQHALTTFLHKLGCRWFFPGAVWEVIPQRKTIEVRFDERQVPSFSLGRHIHYGFGAFPPCARDLEDWNRHNRMGGPIPVSMGHTWFGLNPDRDFAAHPEWFALVAGKRKAAKPCYSHPDVIKQGIRHALEMAAGGARLVSLSPPDGLGYCECERCLAVCKGGKTYQKHLSTFARRPDGVEVSVASETVFAFVNAVAAAVAAKYPDVYVGCMAYSAYAHPPSFKPHPNILVQVTTAYRRTDLTLEQQLSLLRERGCQAGLREYFSVYQWDWDARPPEGRLAPAKMPAAFRNYYENGVRCINAEASNNWAPRGLSYYLSSCLLWDTRADVEALLRDFYASAFGPAADAMKSFYRHWYGSANLSTSETPGSETGERAEEAMPRDKLRAMFQDLDEAMRLTKDRLDCQARVDHLRMYVHYLVLRQQTLAAGAGKDLVANRKAILDAVRAETQFAGRLTSTNMIHSRPVLGKAFLRRFKQFETILKDVPEAQKPNAGWRAIGRPPTHAELEELWSADREQLGIKS